MDLPVYKNIIIESIQIDELNKLLDKEMNHYHPVVFNLKLLNLDQQREIIGLIENFFSIHNISFKFPYPVYIITDHEKSITGMPTAKRKEELPRFFKTKFSKLNFKESQIVSRNKLLQIQIKNVASQVLDEQVQSYGNLHHQIYKLECETDFYRSLLSELTSKARFDG
jgi:hypothetical protein